MHIKVKKQLSDIGINNISEIVYNPSYDLLYNEENDENLSGFEKVQNTEYGAVNVMTGIYTGRSPKDKYILKDETTKDNLWWSSENSKNDNKPINKDVYAINEIIFLFFTRFTIEWNLNSSIPVSASYKSLVRFSKSNIKIAAKVNEIKL